MKSILLVIALLSLGACAVLGTNKAPSQGIVGDATLLQQLPGEYDNHAQVWQAEQAKVVLLPVQIRQHITAVKGQAGAWDWRLSMASGDGEPIVANWRYTLRTLASGSLMLTPARALPLASGEKTAAWAELAPCAMQGDSTDGHMRLAANKDACSAIIAGLGANAALLPLILDFDGKHLNIQTYADMARGSNAEQSAQRVHWYQGWVAINGAGPDAVVDSKDWHMQRNLRIGNQGQDVQIQWRDGNPSGYSLRLESLDYRKRDMQVLRLSLIRDQDGDAVAYAWGDPGAEHIGLNLGWVQIGLSSGQGGSDPVK